MSTQSGTLGARVAPVCGVIAGALGLGSLLGWWTGHPFLATYGVGRIPMAPSAAVLFIGFGATLILRGATGRAVSRVVVGVGVTGLLGAVLFLVLSAYGIHWRAEYLGMRITGSVAGVPIGHMSPLTAAGFLLAGIALLTRRLVTGRRWTLLTSLAAAAVLLFLAGMLTVAYLLGGPLLYNTGVIPPALPTALGHLALGCGLLADAIPRGWMSRARQAWHGRMVFRLASAMLLGFVFVTTTSFFVFRDYQRRFRAAVQNDLASIVDLKVDGIVQWRAERAADALSLADNEVFAGLLLRAFEGGPADDAAWDRIRTWLELVRSRYGYERAAVADLAGVERVASPGMPQDHPELEAAVPRAVSGGASFLDLRRDAPDAPIEMAVLAPVRDTEGGRTIGVVVLWIDPGAYLYPGLQRWPTSSRTSETLLVRRDGDHVLFLNDLRFHDDAALRFSLPLSDEDLPAAMAVSGAEGVVEGIDYRGEAVLAAARAVPGTPWFLVARQDVAELMAPLRQRLFGTLGVISALLLGLGAMMAIIWQREETAYFRRLALAETARRESEERYRITLQSIGDAVIATDPDGRVEFLNPEAGRLTGWTDEEARGRPLDEVFRIIDEETREVAESPVERVLREGDVVGLASHTVLIARDGTERPVADSGAPIRAGGGAVTGVVIVFRDQTEEREADRRLHEQVERSRRYLDVAGVMIVGLDRVGRVALINERGLQTLGYAREEEILGKDWFENFVPEGERERVHDIFDRAMAGDLAFAERAENRVLTRSGAERLIAWKNALVRDGAGNIIRTLSSGEDITERHAAEEALRLSEARHRHLFESMAQGVVYQDQDGVIVSANPAAERILGLTLDQMQGRTSTHPEWRALREDGSPFPGEEHPAMIALATGRPVWGVIMGVYHPETDETRWIQVDAMPERIQDRPGAFQVYTIFTDITERRRAEEKEARLQEQLLQVQKMESVGRLAGGVAHDFNNMLAVILGHADMVLEELDTGDPLRQEIEEIENAAHRSASLTRQLLAFARRQTIAPKVLDLSTTVEGLLNMLRRLIGEDTELVWRPAPRIWNVNVDPAQVDQVVANLVVNARDALEDRGSIVIETANVMFDEAYVDEHPGFVSGDYVMLSVSDDGCGMDSATMDRIFDPFFTTKSPGEGTGLGLATVYGIVKQNDGFINVYSEPGAGTTFKVYLPRFQGEDADSAAPVIEVVGGSETVLVVEDEEAVRDVSRRFLKGFGYTVLTAESPEDALRLAREHDGRLDLLLTDVVMPGMNGRELADYLVRDGHPDLKTLFMSGYTADVIAHKGVLDESVHFIEKPFSRATLGIAVREALDAN